MLDALRMLGTSLGSEPQRTVIIDGPAQESFGNNGRTTGGDGRSGSAGGSLLPGIYRMLGVLCTISILAMLYFARDAFIPIALALALGLLLRPAVRYLHRRHIPEVVGAFLCLATVVVLIAAVIVPLLSPAQDWLNDLPHNFKLAREKLRVLREHANQWTQVRSEIAELASSDEEESPPVPVTVR